MLIACIWRLQKRCGAGYPTLMGISLNSNVMQVAALCTSKPHLDDDNEQQPHSQSTLANWSCALWKVNPKTSFVFLYLPFFFFVKRTLYESGCHQSPCQSICKGALDYKSMNGSMLMQLDCHSCDNNKQNQLLHEKNDGFFFLRPYLGCTPLCLHASFWFVESSLDITFDSLSNAYWVGLVGDNQFSWSSPTQFWDFGTALEKC